MSPAKCLSAFLALSLALLSVTSASADVIYDESVNGDLSGNRLAPISLALAAGVNSLIARTSSGDLEYVHFSLPANHRLDAITLFSYTGGDARAFAGVQAGTTFTETAAAPNVANILGYTHFGTFAPDPNPGEDMLAPMGLGAGAIGFTPPLTGPDYTFWIQQIGAAQTNYRLDYVVSVVPEPSSLALLGLGLLLMAGRVRLRT